MELQIYLVGKVCSLELDRPKQGPTTHPTPPHLKIILMANIFNKTLSTWTDINGGHLM